MNRVLAVARTEVIEHRRQPSMLFIMALNYLIAGAMLFAALRVLGPFQESPERLAEFQEQARVFGITDLSAALSGALTVIAALVGVGLVGNLSAFVAFIAGYSVLHDRDCGALPFLMLAPLTRFQLLLGKTIGAMALPTVLHFVATGSITLGARQFRAMDPFSTQFGGSAAWWIAFLVGVPASGYLLGAVGTVISSLSTDVRTSMQLVNFFNILLATVVGAAFFNGIALGSAAQVGFTAACVILGTVILAVASRIISRDFRP